MVTPPPPPQPARLLAEHTYGLLAFACALDGDGSDDKKYHAVGMGDTPVKRDSAGVYLVQPGGVFDSANQIFVQLTPGPDVSNVQFRWRQDANGSFVIETTQGEDAIDAPWVLVATKREFGPSDEGGQ